MLPFMPISPPTPWCLSWAPVLFVPILGASFRAVICQRFCLTFSPVLAPAAAFFPRRHGSTSFGVCLLPVQHVASSPSPSCCNPFLTFSFNGPSSAFSWDVVLALLRPWLLRTQCHDPMYCVGSSHCECGTSLAISWTPKCTSAVMYVPFSPRFCVCKLSISGRQINQVDMAVQLHSLYPATSPSGNWSFIPRVHCYQRFFLSPFRPCRHCFLDFSLSLDNQNAPTWPVSASKSSSSPALTAKRFSCHLATVRVTCSTRVEVASQLLHTAEFQRHPWVCTP